MPPLVSRKRAAAKRQTATKKDLREHASEDEYVNSNGDSNHENKGESDLSYQTKTPIKQPSTRAGKTSASASAKETAPPDTLVALKRTRRAIVEKSPSPRPVASRGRQKVLAKGQGASKPTGRRAASTKGRSTSATAVDSEDEVDHKEDQDQVLVLVEDENKNQYSSSTPFFGESANGSTAAKGISSWHRDRANVPSDSEEDVALATPTKRRGKAAQSLGSPSSISTRSLSKGTATNANAESRSPLGRGSRKRRTGTAEEIETSDLAASHEGHANRKRTRSSKTNVYVEIDSIDKNQHAEPPEPATPTTRSRSVTASNKSKTHAKGSKADVVRNLKHEVYVDIVSPSKFELSRSKIKSSGRQSSTLGASRGKDALESLPFSSPASKDGEKWQKKYEELFALRQTKPEQELEKFRQSAHKRFDASDVLIEKLRKEIAHIKKSANKGKSSEDSKKASKTASAPEKSASEKELEKQVALLRKDVEALTQDVLVKDETIERLEQHRKLTETSTDYNLREKLRLIQELSGLSIDDVVPEDDGVSYVCRQSGPATDATFVLTAFDDIPNEYQYTPCGNTTTLEVLPEYLKESMSFAKPAANMFFWRLCDHLHNNSSSQQQSESPSNNQDKPEFQQSEVAKASTDVDANKAANTRTTGANGDVQT
ncbi:hypothetical protein FB639_001205 [Coemansia asiatica]|nr:hypothetical protein FB639_001205 [Coemansia asiatica]